MGDLERAMDSLINSIPKPFDKMTLAGGWGLAAFYGLKACSSLLNSAGDKAKEAMEARKTHLEKLAREKDESKAAKFFECADVTFGNKDGILTKEEFKAASESEKGKALGMGILFGQFAAMWTDLES